MASTWMNGWNAGNKNKPVPQQSSWTPQQRTTWAFGYNAGKKK